MSDEKTTWRGLLDSPNSTGLAAEGCCANCATCTPVGVCLNEDALLSVRCAYPLQSDFRCRYYVRRARR